MPEIKQPVQAMEVNYVCDKCGHGMMVSAGDMNPSTGEIPHKCMICSHQQMFKWVSYPKITYVGLDEGSG